MLRARKTFLLLVFLLSMSASAALAASATYAEVNGVTLTSASPYWKNGGGASETDWNAFFDTGTSPATLWLKDAVIDTVSPFNELVYADGDLVLKLLGHSVLSYSGTIADEPAGIAVEGNLWIRDGTAGGTGSIDITIENYTIPYDYACGICTYNSLTIDSGTIDINVVPAIRVEGLYVEIGENITINGGRTTIYGMGLSVAGLSADLFTLAGGEIRVAVTGILDPSSCGVEFLDALVTGGYGEFVNDGAGFGGIWYWADSGFFRVIDGRLIFSGVEGALAFDTGLTLVPYVTDRIYASTDASGTGKFLWDPSKGVLADNYTNYSDFRYVELVGNGVALPRTGDRSQPWLWAGIGAAVVLLAGAAVLWFRRRK